MICQLRNPFLVHRGNPDKAAEILENEYSNIMLQQHILKRDGHYSILEMNLMTYEDRRKIIELINDDKEREKEAIEKSKNSSRK